MTLCSQCIIPSTARGISFNPMGLCNLCANYKKKRLAGIEELNKIINATVSNGPEFNCVVPVSGGRDSAYALFFAKRILGLRPIALHNDNDFETEAAKANLKRMEVELNVPLIKTSSRNKLSMKIVTEKLKMNLPFGPALILDQTCEACKYGFESAAYNTAKRYKLKIVIWGDSQNESTADFYWLNKHKSPSIKDRILSGKALNLIRYKYFFSQMKKEYGSNQPEGLMEIHLYDFIEWDRKTILETITKEMKWEKPQESATSWRTDCRLVPLVNSLTDKAYGVSKFELGFSSMIRSGKMTRAEALGQINEMNKISNTPQLKILLKEMGVSNNEIRNLLVDMQ